MKGRTLPPTASDVGWLNASSYVQINIYGTNLEELREHGVDMKNILQNIGFRSIVMDVPILIPDATKPSVPLNDRRTKSLGCNVIVPEITRSLVEIPCCKSDVFVQSEKSARKITRSNSSPELSNRDANLCTSVEDPNLDATCDTSYYSNREADDTVHVDQLGSIDDSLAPAKVLPLPETAAMEIEKPSQESPLNCGVSRIASNRLESIGPEWLSPSFTDERPIVKKVEEESDVWEEGCSRVLAELQNLSCVSLSPSWNSGAARCQNISIPTELRDGTETEINQAVLAQCEIASCGSESYLNSDGRSRTSTRKRNGLRRKLSSEVSNDSQKPSSVTKEKNTKKRGVKRLKSLLENGQQCMTFECRMLGCSTILKWNPRVGRNRLVDHVRTHWRKEVKNCKLCEFKAKNARGIHRHHMREHPNEPYMGAISKETKEDLEELQRLYTYCFPGVVDDQFCNGTLPLIGVRSSHTRRIKPFGKRSKNKDLSVEY
ncbi:hypothetical protein GCK32_004680 [Trichostrongylus colubriformis]|uniref:Uncharacterized protein n=1 Tax=Trichostrongylus colubriformis TaxID=6319 RepID=A0AAN8G2H0_TRICO